MGSVYELPSWLRSSNSWDSSLSLPCPLAVAATVLWGHQCPVLTSILYLEAPQSPASGLDLPPASSSSCRTVLNHKESLKLPNVTWLTTALEAEPLSLLLSLTALLRPPLNAQLRACSSPVSLQHPRPLIHHNVASLIGSLLIFPDKSVACMRTGP